MCIIRAIFNGGGLPYSIVQYFHQIAYTTDMKVKFEKIIIIIRSNMCFYLYFVWVFLVWSIH